MSRDGWERGCSILLFLGGGRITVPGKRAIARTKMTIMRCGAVRDVPCDVTCTGRFYDFLELRAGRWAIVLRQPIYEKDRIDPVDHAADFTLDPSLAAFPEGYRHLAYQQTQLGFAVKRDMPGLCGAEVERLYARGAAWLAGEPLTSPAGATPARPGSARPSSARPGSAAAESAPPASADGRSHPPGHA